MSTDFWIQMVVYAISIGSLAGTILTRLKYLEKKMDAHNGLMVRMATAEQSIQTLCDNIKEMKEDM